MTDFVLDNSIAMRWILESNKEADQLYAIDVLQSLENQEALVPNLWHLEAANVLLNAEKRSDITLGEIEGFIAQLENLPIHIDHLTAQQSFSRTLTLGRTYNISSYDASYLEIAIREAIPLATLDKNLVKAASAANVRLYLK